MLRSIPIGVENLRANPLRTALSTLGVVIGVASLVAILALGDGLEQFTRAQIEQTTDLQLVNVTSATVDRVDGVMVRRLNPVVFTPALADSIAASLGERAEVALSLTGSGWVRAEADTAPRAALITAVTPSAAPVMGIDVESGRWFTAGDSAASPLPVIVSASMGRPAGTRFDLQGAPAVVIGVQRGPATGPLRVYRVLTAGSVRELGDDGRTAPQMLVKARRVEDVESLRADVERLLAARWPAEPRPFSVQSSARRVAQARQGILVFKLIMGSITGISLLVGGIGIMNIMLASVAERTREIGIRKAVGARAADVRAQFLAESIAISGAGSLVGVVLGLGGAFGITAAIRKFTDSPMHAGFSWGTVLVAAIAAIVVGVVFGTYPARRAARLSPIEAIRHE